MTLSGVVDVTPIAATADRFTLLFEFSHLQLGAHGGDDTLRPLDNARPLLGTPCIASFVGGRVAELYAPAELDPLAMGIARNLLAVWEHVPADRAAARWEARQRDATGEFIASYEVSGPETVRKRKIKYLNLTIAGTNALAGPQATIQPPSVVDSSITVHGDPRMPAAIDADEKLRIDTHGGLPLVSQTAISLVRNAKQPDLDAVARAAAARARTTSVALDRPYGSGATRSIDLAKIDGLSLEQIVSALEAHAGRAGDVRLSQADNGVPLASSEQAKGKAWMAEQSRLFSALTATLRQVPGSVRRVSRLVTKGTPAWRALISALGECGREDAHEALLTLMDDRRLPEDVRSSAGMSLLRTPTPSPTALRGVEAKLGHPDWHRLATYGLGTYARILRSRGDVAEAKRIVRVLVDLIANAAERERGDLLKALSNSAAPETFEVARRWLPSPSADVRRGAVTVLRLLQGADAEALILAVLRSDTSKDVRLAALRALDDREPSEAAGRAVAAAARGDVSERVRYESVQLLGRWKTKLGFLASDLQAVAANDAEGAIRNAAVAALSH